MNIKMDNPLSVIVNDIWSYLFKLPETHKLPHKQQKAYMHCSTDCFKQNGDITFASNISICWESYIRAAGGSIREARFLRDIGNDSQKIQRAQEAMVEHAQEWAFPVIRMQFTPERCKLFLQRNIVITQIMHLVLGNTSNGSNNCYGKLQKNINKRIYLKTTYDDEPNDLSEYRAKALEQALARILEYSAWNVESSEIDEQYAASAVKRLQVLSIAAKDFETRRKECITIKCDIAKDPDTRKLSKMPIEDYLNLRSKDLVLIAMHKYGLRDSSDNRFLKNLSKRLGSATAIIDMLGVKHTSAFQMVHSAAGSSRGAAFILYNSARLETLLRNFNARVLDSTYSPLPPLEEVDFSVLNEEEEWQLIFGYVFTFPNLMEHALDQIEKGLVGVHLIVHFISGFMSAFSVYYKRVRILIAHNENQVALLNARIYLLMALRDVLTKALKLFDIEPMATM